MERPGQAKDREHGRLAAVSPPGRRLSTDVLQEFPNYTTHSGTTFRGGKPKRRQERDFVQFFSCRDNLSDKARALLETSACILRLISYESVAVKATDILRKDGGGKKCRQLTRTRNQGPGFLKESFIVPFARIQAAVSLLT